MKRKYIKPDMKAFNLRPRRILENSGGGTTSTLEEETWTEDSESSKPEFELDF